LLTFTGIQQLFLVGAIAIAVGVFTYSKKVMLTVGDGLMTLSPVAAWVVVIAHSIVLFLFASEGLEHMLASAGLPTIPLVPVSSSQAVVGAIVGIGILKGGRNIQWRVLGSISAGWITTPIISALVCFVALFFLQNVFNQQVYREINYSLMPAAMDRIVTLGLPVEDLKDIEGRTFRSASNFRDAVRERTYLTGFQESEVLYYAEISRTSIRPEILGEIDREWLGEERTEVLGSLVGQSFVYKWQLAERLSDKSDQWKLLKEMTVNKTYNKQIKSKLDYIFRTFAIAE
jgi:PiT family inorganic phosphate transporter